jgi:hypothetical protein
MQTGGSLLRLKAIVAGEKQEALSAHYNGILSIEGATAVLWINSLPCQRE